MNLHNYNQSVIHDQADDQEIDYFKTSEEHLFSELKRIDILVQIAVAKARLIYNSNDQFRGLYISDDDIDRCLNQPIGSPRWRFNIFPDCDEGENSLYGVIKSNVNASLEQSINKNIDLRLIRLKKVFNLNDFDIDVILISLLIEVDLRYEKIFGYLQDDITKKLPSVNLIFELLCVSVEEVFSNRKRFMQNSPLIKHKLIKMIPFSEENDHSILSRYIVLDRHITSFLLGYNDIDDRLAGFLEKNIGEIDESASLIKNDQISDFIDVLNKNIRNNITSIFYLQGKNESGKHILAKNMALKSGKPLLVVNCNNMLHNNKLEIKDTIDLIQRESRLQDAFVYLSDFSEISYKNNDSTLDYLLSKLSFFNLALFISGTDDWEPSIANCMFMKLEFPVLNFTQRIESWKMELNNHDHNITENEVNELAGKYSFTGIQIRKAINISKNSISLHKKNISALSIKDIYKACKCVSNGEFVAFSKKIEPKYTLNDIVLPLNQTKQLCELINTIKYKSCVYEKWGFDEKLSLGKGVNVLFTGPSGTGKTMAAEIIANELDLNIYKINLSSVFSKYIGETEKHIEKIFENAKETNGILFFDEADSLFGKRTSVSTSNDRYANLETNYLLQKIEEYEGVVILATNLRKNMDSAFLRRINITITFPFPNEEQRKIIWEKIWPDSSPLSDDLDFEFLSKKFKFTGGEIKNIALSAAFLAIDDNQVIENKHLIWATKRELEKMGKVCVGTDFGPYFRYTKDEYNLGTVNDT